MVWSMVHVDLFGEAVPFHSDPSRHTTLPRLSHRLALVGFAGARCKVNGVKMGL